MNEAKAPNLTRDPFEQLDAYEDEAYNWASKMLEQIDFNRLKEKNIHIVSAAFAYIFSVFIHLSMKYLLPDFEGYFLDSPDKFNSGSWDKMHKCVSEIYSQLSQKFKDPLEIYKPLYDSILIEVEDDEYDHGDGKLHPIKVEPYDYNEDKGFDYVSGGFSY